MKEKLVSVKTYHLSGDGVKIVFTMENPDILELIYEDKQGERKFSGRAIHREKIQLGFVPSVVLEDVPDSHTIILSLVVPLANISEDVRSVPIDTFMVRTTNRTSIAGPGIIEGQIQTHEVHVLEGNAW